jgi:hypothetical protein
MQQMAPSCHLRNSYISVTSADLPGTGRTSIASSENWPGSVSAHCVSGDDWPPTLEAGLQVTGSARGAAPVGVGARNAHQVQRGLRPASNEEQNCRVALGAGRVVAVGERAADIAEQSPRIRLYISNQLSCYGRAREHSQCLRAGRPISVTDCPNG